MKKLSQKFIYSITAVLVLVIATSLFLNHTFIERYYLHQKKQEILTFCHALTENGADFGTVAKQIEKEHQVVIVKVPNTGDNDKINVALQQAFQDRGLSLEKYWLWEKDYERAVESGGQLRIYAQPQLNYSVLVGYDISDGDFFAVAMIIPNVNDMISLINWMTVAVFGGAVLLIVLLIVLLVQRITKPLGTLKLVANQIAEQNFSHAQVHTGDELEALADSLNIMSDKLSRHQAELEEKNRQMEALLNNVSHDLKTPVALIKAYTAGIRDGLDDGTFLDTLTSQTERMEQMIGRLLALSKISVQEAMMVPFDLAALIGKISGNLAIQAEARGLAFHQCLPAELWMDGNFDSVESLVDNLVSNAVKYAGGDEIRLCLAYEEDGAVFTVENQMLPGTALELERIWEPFYVGEKSRSKELSGTGLGLSMVRAVAQRYGYGYSAEQDGNRIRFTIKFKLSF